MTAATIELTALEQRNHSRIARGSWALYDLANTIWSYAVFSFAIGLFLVDSLGDANGNFALQLSVALSVGINALVSPFLGAISDRYGRRLPFLLFFTLLACLPAIAIPFVPVSLGILMFCIANFGYQSALIYYDATLQLVSTPQNRGWMSGLGNAVGYMGTVLIVVILLVTGLDVVQTFVVAPILFLVAAPMFLPQGGRPARRGARPSGGLERDVPHDPLPERVPGLGRFLAAASSTRMPLPRASRS